MKCTFARRGKSAGEILNARADEHEVAFELGQRGQHVQIEAFVDRSEVTPDGSGQMREERMRRQRRRAREVLKLHAARIELDLLAQAAAPLVERAAAREDEVRAGQERLLARAAGNPPILRINGELTRVDYPPLEDDQLKIMLYEIAPEYKIKTFEETGDVDFGYEIANVSRFRANFFTQKIRHRGGFSPDSQQGPFVRGF